MNLSTEKTCGWRQTCDNLGLIDAKLLPLEWISNEILLYSTGDYI